MKNADTIQMFLDGASGRTANLYIEGNVLYSYGPHFPIAIRKNNVMILNLDKYSHTTSRHQSLLRRALRNDPYYSVVDSTLSHLKILLGEASGELQSKGKLIKRDYFGKEI